MRGYPSSALASRGHLLDADLIGFRAQFIIAARQAFGEWKAHRHVDRDKAREEFAILKDAMKEVRALSRLLALTPASARQSTRPDDPETSYYDRTRLLEGRRDGEPN